MADSHFGLIGRGLGVLAAASLLAGVSLEAAASDATKRLALQTGKTLDAFRIDYEETNSTSGLWVPMSLPQTFQSSGGCTFTLTDNVTGNDYLVLAPSGTSKADLGWVATSVGVYDGPRGTGCGRISSDKKESLEVTLGPDVPGQVLAFDRIELDLEVKGDVRLLVEIKYGNRVNKYYLRAGAGQVSGTPDPDGTVLAGSKDTYNCSVSSDSGPDSGPSDNCRLRIEDVGQSFKITSEVGEVSLEGGGDFADVEGNRTLIYLAEPDGSLACGDTRSSGDEAMTCQVTRLNPGGTAECVAVPYIFRTGGGSCELLVDASDQQFVANLFVAYQPEAAPAGNLSATTWPDVALSRVSFADETVLNATHPIPACLGTTIRDVLNKDGDPGSDGQVDPIPQIAAIGVDGALDRVKGNDSIDFACAFERSERLGTNPDSPYNLLLDMSEWIQFWGDIKFERF